MNDMQENPILIKVRELRRLLNSRSNVDVSENILLLKYQLLYERELKYLERNMKGLIEPGP